jgi:phosphoribosylformylglycinamidine (FGAM) synthase PurS component
VYRIEVSVKEGFADPRSEGLQKDILDLGIKTVKHVKVSSVYLLDGNLDDKELVAVWHIIPALWTRWKIA